MEHLRKTIRRGRWRNLGRSELQSGTLQWEYGRSTIINDYGSSVGLRQCLLATIVRWRDELLEARLLDGEDVGGRVGLLTRRRGGSFVNCRRRHDGRRGERCWLMTSRAHVGVGMRWFAAKISKGQAGLPTMVATDGLLQSLTDGEIERPMRGYEADVGRSTGSGSVAL